jgi:putative Mn2+ efflux pump MntP
MLTLTKRGAFWLVVFFAVAVAMDVGVSALVGQQEPMFALFALAIAAIFLVTGTYTVGKKIVGLFRRKVEKEPDE